MSRNALRRRWPRFSLRTLLILTALVAVWLGVQVNKAQKQRAAVAAIEAAGGQIIYDWEYLAWQHSMTPPGSGIGHPQPAWLRYIVGDDYFQEIAVVMIHYDDLSPELYERLRQLDTLSTVFIEGRKDLTPVQEALPGVEILRFSTAAG